MASVDPSIKVVTIEVSLRDWFAGMAMNGLMSMKAGLPSGIKDSDEIRDEIAWTAIDAYHIADEMMYVRMTDEEKDKFNEIAE